MSTFSDRRAIVLDVATRDPIRKYINGKHTHAYALARSVRNPTDPEALECWDRTTPPKGKFDLFTMALAYHQFSDQWPVELRDKVAADLKAVDHYFGGGTENHKSMRRAAALLIGEALPDAIFHDGLTGRDMFDRALADVQQYSEVLHRGTNSEHLSPVYWPVSVSVWANLATALQDVTARAVCDDIAVHFTADLAANHFVGSVAATRRNAPAVAGVTQPNYPLLQIQTAAWLYFGVHGDDWLQDHEPEIPLSRNWILLAVAGWEPPEYVVGAAVFRTESYSVRQSVPSYYDCIDREAECNPRHVVREVYMHPDYVLATAYPANWQDPTEPDAEHFGLFWKSEHEQNSLRIAHPSRNADLVLAGWDEPLGDEDWADASQYRSHAQLGGVYLAIYDIPMDAKYQDVYVYLPDSIEVIERGGAYWAQDGDVYLMIRPSGESELLPTRHRGFRRIKWAGPLVGVAIAVGSAKEFGWFPNFAQHYDSSVFDFSQLSEDFTIRYKDALSLRLNGGTFPVISVYGRKVEREEWPL